MNWPNLRRPTLNEIQSAPKATFTPASLPGLVVAPILAASRAAGKLFEDTGDTVPASANTDPIRHLLTPPYGAVMTFAAPSDAARPTLVIDAGKSWSRFDGSNDVLQASDAGLPTGSADRTFGIAFKLDATGTNQSLLSYGTAALTQGIYLFINAGDNKLNLGQYGASVGGTLTALTTGVPYRLVVKIASGIWTAYLNGVIEGSPTTMTTNTVAGGTLSLGSDSLGSLANADFAGWVITGSSSFGLATLDTYLASLMQASGVAYLSTTGTDSTAVLGDAGLPFLTTARAALRQTLGGQISAGAGTFASLTTPKRLVVTGTATPTVNGGNTALTGGTIFQGQFDSSGSGVSLSTCGVDVGKAFCDANFAGTPQEGLYCDSPLSGPIITGPTWRNVIVLAYAKASAVHCMRIENAVADSLIDGCTTKYGHYGPVIKSDRATITNHTGISHGVGAVIVKADTGQTTTGVRVTGLTCTDCAAAVVITGTGGTVDDVICDTATITGGNGVAFLGTGPVGSITIRNYTHTGGDNGYDSRGITGTVAAFIVEDSTTANATTVGLAVGASTTLATFRRVTVTGTPGYGGLFYGPTRLETVSFPTQVFIDPAIQGQVTAPSPASVTLGGGYAVGSGTIVYDTP